MPKDFIFVKKKVRKRKKISLNLFSRSFKLNISLLCSISASIHLFLLSSSTYQPLFNLLTVPWKFNKISFFMIARDSNPEKKLFPRVHSLQREAQSKFFYSNFLLKVIIFFLLCAAASSLPLSTHSLTHFIRFLSYHIYFTHIKRARNIKYKGDLFSNGSESSARKLNTSDQSFI